MPQIMDAQAVNLRGLAELTPVLLQLDTVASRASTRENEFAERLLGLGTDVGEQLPCWCAQRGLMVLALLG